MDATLWTGVIGAGITAIAFLYVVIFGQRSVPEMWKSFVANRRKHRELQIADKNLLTTSSTIIYKEDTRLTALAISPKGENIVFGGFSNKVLLLSVESKEVTSVLAHESIIRCLRFESLKPIFSSCSDDGSIQICYPRTNEFRYIGKHQGPVYDLAFHPTLEVIASVGQDGSVKFWEIIKSPIQQLGSRPQGSQQRPVIIKGKGRDVVLFGVDFNQTGDLIATGGSKGIVSLTNIKSRQPRKFGGFKKTVFCVKFDPTGNYLAACGEDKIIRIWNLITDECQILAGHNHTVRSLNFHDSGKFIVSASKDTTIRIWEISSSRCWVLEGHSDYVYMAAFHPNGKEIYSVGGDGTLRQWNVPDAVLEIVEKQ